MTEQRLSYEDQVAALMDSYPTLSRLPATLLLILLGSRGRIVTRARLVDEVEEIIGRDLNNLSLSCGIKRLRRAISPHGMTIQTVYGIGYRLPQTLERKEDGLSE